MSFDVIKRPKRTTILRNEDIKSLLTSSIFPDWYEEVSDENRFFYRMGNALHSIAADVKKEYFITTSQFSYTLLDYTKTYYATKYDTDLYLPIRARLKSSLSTDALYSDIYQAGYPIEDLGDERIKIYESLRFLMDNGHFEHITSFDLDILEEQTDIKDDIISALEDNETILSGDILAATSLGRVVSFTGEDPGVESATDTQDFSITNDDSYIILPALTIESSLIFYDPSIVENELDNNDEKVEELTNLLDTTNDSDGNELNIEINDGINNLNNTGIIELNIQNINVGRFASSESYNPVYDIDKDGFISPEDVQFLNNAIGQSIDTINESEWRNIYQYLDKDKDGIISRDDVLPGLSLVNISRSNSYILRNPNPGFPILIEGEAFDAPGVVYASLTDSINSNVFGVENLLPSTEDIRISDGYIESIDGNIIGINIEQNQIYGGHRLESGFALKKIGYPTNSRMLVSGITQVDNVAHIVLYGENGYKYKDLASIAILRIDIEREAIDLSTDIIPIYNIDLQSDEVVTGITSTERKDTFRIFTSTPNIYTVKLELEGVTTLTGDIVLASEGFEKLVDASSELGRQKIFNPIDNFGFNLGRTRTYGENNKDFLKRIKERYINPYGNDIIGFHKGVADELGNWEPSMYYNQDISLFNSISVDLPIRVEFQDLKRDDIDDVFLLVNPVTIEDPALRTISIFDPDNGTQDIEITSLESNFYAYNTGDIVTDNTIILKHNTLRELMKLYLRMVPESVLTVPDFDEVLVEANVSLIITYSALDGDGIIHNDISEVHSIYLPSIDQIDSAEENENMSDSISSINPDSKTADHCIRSYSLTRKNTKEYIGDNKWNYILENIRSLDVSSWKNTEIDTGLFNDKYNTYNIVSKTEFNSAEFDDETIEVDL